MHSVDIVLTILGLLALAAGWARGVIVSFSAFVGFIAGLVLGRLFAEPLSSLIGASLATETTPAWAAPLVPILAGIVLSILGEWLGRSVRRALHKTPGKWVDASLGAVAGLMTFVLTVWLSAAWVRSTPFVLLNEVVAESKIVDATDNLVPGDSQKVLGAVDRALQDNGFPTVFSGQRERIRGIGEPNRDMIAVGRLAHDETVRVITDKSKCPNLMSGSGWIFARDYIATNAHVVAGSTSVQVQIGGRGEAHGARLVAFDSKRDVAVLYVPGLEKSPLKTGAPLKAGDDAVAVGYPGGSPYTISPARVRESLSARGLDIYDSKPVVRDVYSIRGIIREGNSGGPLLNGKGEVVGMVFAKSLTDKETGYALTLDEIQPILHKGEGAEDEVSSGRCTTSG